MLPDRVSRGPDLNKSLGNLFPGMHDQFIQATVQRAEGYGELQQLVFQESCLRDG